MNELTTQRAAEAAKKIRNLLQQQQQIATDRCVEFWMNAKKEKK